ncbi:MAG: proteasome subunit beta [Actinomycetota bacterium]
MSKDFPTAWTKAAFSFEPNPSFVDLLRTVTPEATHPQSPGGMVTFPEGTTILAMVTSDGVVVAGDRRATEGHTIADRKMEKVFPADRFSAVAIAGAAGPAIEMVRLFQTELEHYEKLEGENLSLEGKANRLAQMIRANFPMAMQGLVVVPVFSGYDDRRGEGRIYRYDAVGGRYEETQFHATGSGGVHARGTLRREWKPGIANDDAIKLAVRALADAAQEDAATGGPDLVRGIFPIVATVTSDGYLRVPDATLATITAELADEGAL